MADTLLGFASIHFTQLGYITIMLGSLAEGLSLPFPSVVLMVMAGAAVARGKMSFGAVVVLAALAYTIGSVVPYVIGYNLPKLKRYPWCARFADKTPFWRVNDLFEKHGNKIVALSRPFLIGNCVSYVAGITHMSPAKFVAYTFVGILPWAVAATTVGLLFGSNIERAINLFQNYSNIVGIVLAMCVVAYYLTKRYRKNHL